MRQQEVRDYIKIRLGYPSVVVELDDVQLDVAIQDALDKFNNYMCRVVGHSVMNQTATLKVVLDEHARGVLNVRTLRPREAESYSKMSVFELMYRMVFPRMPISDWVLLRSTYKSYQRARGTDPDWVYEQSTRTLWVDCSSGPYDVYYLVAEDLTVNNIDLTKPGYMKDFRDYVVGLAKLTLANVRGKFGSSIPVPGGSLMTDADVLRSDAIAMLDKIDLRLENRGKYAYSPIMWG